MAPPTITPMLDLLPALREVPGDFIEFGVFRGRSFGLLLPVAEDFGKILHGVDSFAGMGKPGERDYLHDGECPFPEHLFDTADMAQIVDDAFRIGYTPDDYQLYQGFVPDVLDTMPDLTLSFAFLDLDHYEPTKAALTWVWDRVSTGGIMVCDDFIQTHRERLANGAITEFIEREVPRVVRVNQKQIAFRKG